MCYDQKLEKNLDTVVESVQRDMLWKREMKCFMKISNIAL